MTHRTYDEVFDLAVHMYQKDGAKAAVSYVEDMLAGTTGELRGRLLALLAEFTTYSGDNEAALGLYLDALGLVTTPEHRFSTLACAMDACVESRRFKQGMRFAVEADAIRSIHDAIPDRWLGVYYMNSGRLSLTATDYVSAAEDLKLSARHFRATGNREDEAQNADLYLAEGLLYSGACDAALTICHNVRRKATNAYVRLRLDVVEGLVNAKLGNMMDAKRLAMRCIEVTSKKLGTKVASTWIMSLLLVAEITKQERGGAADDLLRIFIENVASYGQIDATEVIKGVIG